MALKDLKRVETEDIELFKVQENIRDYILQFDKNLLSGTILKDVPVGVTSTDVTHGLARRYQGWHLIDIQGDARVWRDTTATSDNTKFLPLKASATVTVSLWVF